ncbi:hypothetical protein ACLOJK_029235, partial [Asimina triloba]
EHRTASVLGEQSPKSLDPVSFPHRAASVGQQAWAAGEHPSAAPILIQHDDGILISIKESSTWLRAVSFRQGAGISSQLSSYTIRSAMAIHQLQANPAASDPIHGTRLLHNNKFEQTASMLDPK